MCTEACWRLFCAIFAKITFFWHFTTPQFARGIASRSRRKKSPKFPEPFQRTDVTAGNCHKRLRAVFPTQTTIRNIPNKGEAYYDLKINQSENRHAFVWMAFLPTMQQFRSHNAMRFPLVDDVNKHKKAKVEHRVSVEKVVCHRYFCVLIVNFVSDWL